MRTRLSVALIALLVALPGLADAGPGRRARLSGDLQDEIRKGNRRTVEVIVDGSDETISRVLGRHPLQLKRRLRRGAVLEVPAGMLDALTADPDVRAVSANAVVTGHMALATTTTGADAAWSGLVASLGAVDGSGIGVAIVDSGISPHSALARQGGRERGLHAQPQSRPRARRIRARHARGRHRRRRELDRQAARPARPAWRPAHT